MKIKHVHVPVHLKAVAILTLTAFAGMLRAQPTQGFFLEDAEKSPVFPVNTTALQKPATSTVIVTLDAGTVVAKAGRYIYGHNANVYMTQMVDQPVLLDHIKDLSPNVIRYPGGNLSSVFFWNSQNGSPPADAPEKLIDANGAAIDPGYWYGTNTENWTLSVDNYYEMLEKTGSTGMITVNYGYARYGTGQDPVAAAAHLAAEWVRYDNGRTRFWEVGNESGGSWQAGFRIDKAANKDGQPEIITGELYGKHFKVFADSMRKAAASVGSQIYIGAQLLAESPASWWNNTDRFWNTGVFTQTGDVPDYYIIHSYYTPYASNSGVAEILESAQHVTTSMMEYVTSQQVEAGVTIKPVALTEWNIFAEGSKQMSSYVNGIHSVLVLAELIRNHYGMAARWDLANGWSNGNDHGIFNQGDEPGNTPRWNPRAAFYYMTLFQQFFGNEMIAGTVAGSQSVVAYGSRFSGGDVSAVIVNKGSAEQSVRLAIQDFDPGDKYYVYSLTGGTDNGQFSLRVLVNGKSGPYQSGGPDLENVPALTASTTPDILFLSPARSVQFVLVEKGDGVVSTEQSNDPRVNIFPNPASGDISISFEYPGISTVEVFDGRGKTVYTECFSDEMKIASKALPKGMLIVRLRNGSRVVYRKLLVR